MSSRGRRAAGCTVMSSTSAAGSATTPSTWPRTDTSVTGLDISPTALITAERRAKDAGVDVKFAVADSTKLEGYADAFDTVIDSGMFHCLDDDGKRSYAAAVHRATRPGATLLLSCFSDANPAARGLAAPGGIRADAARRPRRRGLGHRIAGARPVRREIGRHRNRNGVLVRPRAASRLSFGSVSEAETWPPCRSRRASVRSRL